MQEFIRLFGATDARQDLERVFDKLRTAVQRYQHDNHISSAGFLMFRSCGRILNGMIEAAHQNVGPWRDPLINVEAEEVMLEWWHGDRKLVIHVGADEITVVRRIGGYPPRWRKEQVVSDAGPFSELWTWLMAT
jgi:hypothetical protein